MSAHLTAAQDKLHDEIQVLGILENVDESNDICVVDRTEDTCLHEHAGLQLGWHLTLCTASHPTQQLLLVHHLHSIFAPSRTVSDSLNNGKRTFAQYINFLIV